MAATFLRPAAARLGFSGLASLSARPAARQTLRLGPVVARPTAARAFGVSARCNEIIKKFTEDHEWISVDTSSSTPDVATLGITTYAAQSLGDVVYVELPQLSQSVQAGESVAAVESVKSASDILSPVGGEVVATNTALTDRPGLINQSPEKSAWVVKIKVQDQKELDGLMSKEQYDAFIEK